MVIVDDAAVRAYGDINAGLFIISVSLGADLDQRGSLTAADALGLAGDAYRAAADTDLDEIGAAVGKEPESLGVDYITGADLDAVAVALAYPVDRQLLPFREALGRIYAQNVGARLDEGGNSLGIVAGVDARADYIALVGVEQFVGILLVAVVVLAENEVTELLIRCDYRQRVELVIPDDIVGL